MILLRRTEASKSSNGATHSNGWGCGIEGWDEGGGGCDNDAGVANWAYFAAPLEARSNMDVMFGIGVKSVAMCVSQLYLLEQVINQRTDAPVQRSNAMKESIVSPAAYKAIVVVEAGWVLIGEYIAAKGGKPAHMTDAAVIRRWGTTAGLGQIALTGPTAETILDPCGMVVFDNQQAILFVIKCSV